MSYGEKEQSVTRRLVARGRSYEVIVDAVDSWLLDAHRWYILRGKYVYRPARVNGERVSIYLHRLIAGAAKGLDVDHADRNTLDNRRANLRVCRHAENLRNSKRPASNTSGVKGVYRRKSKSLQWVAEIKVDGRKYWLGAHETLETARLAREKAAARLHGEFARAM